MNFVWNVLTWLAVTALLLARDGLYTVYSTASGSSKVRPPDDGQRKHFEDEDVVTEMTTGPSLSQSWRAGDVVENVCTPGDPIGSQMGNMLEEYYFSSK